MNRPPTSPPALPLDRSAVIDRYFLEHRAKVLDIAAFLDRVDRATPSAGEADRATEDFRLRSIRAAIAVLLDGGSDRARRVLELWSDPTSEPIDRAPMKGATGAWEGFGGVATDGGSA